MQDDNSLDSAIILEDGTKIRGSRKPRYDKVLHFLERLSRVAVKGDQHYSPRSWQRGNGEFIVDTINHAIEHIHKGIEGDRSEDHWVHAAFNCLMMDWFEQNKQNVMDELREKKELPPQPKPENPHIKSEITQAQELTQTHHSLTEEVLEKIQHNLDEMERRLGSI